MLIINDEIVFKWTRKMVHRESYIKGRQIGFKYGPQNKCSSRKTFSNVLSPLTFSKKMQKYDFFLLVGVKLFYFVLCNSLKYGKNWCNSFHSCHISYKRMFCLLSVMVYLVRILAQVSCVRISKNPIYIIYYGYFTSPNPISL